MGGFRAHKQRFAPGLRGMHGEEADHIGRCGRKNGRRVGVEVEGLGRFRIADTGGAVVLRNAVAFIADRVEPLPLGVLGDGWAERGADTPIEHRGLVARIALHGQAPKQDQSTSGQEILPQRLSKVCEGGKPEGVARKVGETFRFLAYGGESLVEFVENSIRELGCESRRSAEIRACPCARVGENGLMNQGRRDVHGRSIRFVPSRAV